MRAKTLNLSSNVYTTLYISDLTFIKDHSYSANFAVTVRLQHDDLSGFSVSEAYMGISKNIPLGAIATNYKIVSEIIDQWYNAEIDATNSFSIYDDVEESAHITATGYVSLIGNRQYRTQLAAVLDQVSKIQTRRKLALTKALL